MKSSLINSIKNNKRPIFTNPEITKTLSNQINNTDFSLDKSRFNTRINQKLKRVKSSNIRNKAEKEKIKPKDYLNINSYMKTLHGDKDKIYEDIKNNVRTLKTETYDIGTNFDKNYINNLSRFSTLWSTEEPKYQKTYYTLSNIKEKGYRDLLKNSENFHKFNKDRKILGKINKFKNQNFQVNEFKKFQQFSYIKRIPIKVAFGLGKSIKSIPEINNTYFNKKLKQQQKRRKMHLSTKMNSLYKKGHNLESAPNLIKDYQKSTSETSHKKLFIIDSSINQLYPKDSFGNEIYSVLTKHKILKNILPKEVDYNTKTSIDDIINSEIHPLLRFQKKALAQSSNLISQELNVLFAKYVRLIKPANDYEEKEQNLDLNANDKFINLMRSLLNQKKDEEKKESIQDNEDDLKINKERRLYLLNKIKDIIILAYKKIKKFNIDINIFYSLMDYNKNDKNFQKELILNGQYLFKAIKAGDIPEIIKTIDKYKYLVAYKDDFNQIPLHICAKRNLYQIINFLLSRLSSIDTQDLGGRTPLMLAAQNNFFEFVTILLFEGANPTIKDFKGNLASDLTNNYKVKTVLKRAEILYNMKCFFKSSRFKDPVVNGLDYLFKKELEIDYEEWFKEGEKILKDLS